MAGSAVTPEGHRRQRRKRSRGDTFFNLIARNSQLLLQGVVLSSVRTMSWNRTGSTLMQASGEFTLAEPLSTALVEAAIRGDKSGVFRLIGQGSWIEQPDGHVENDGRPARTHPLVG